MHKETFRSPPHEIDLVAVQRAIRRAGLLSILATVAAAGAALIAFPEIFDFPTAVSERLAFAARASVFVLLWVLLAVGLVSMGRQRSPEDVGGSAAGPPSERLAIHVAFLQNTLEQAVLAVGLYLALASLVGGPWLSLIIVGIVFFAAGRVLFLRGYHRGAQGRALGMTLTMMPTVLGYLLVTALLVIRLI